MTGAQSQITAPNPIAKAESRRGACKDSIASDLAVSDWLKGVRTEDRMESQETYLLVDAVVPPDALVVATSLPPFVLPPVLPLSASLEKHGIALLG